LEEFKLSQQRHEIYVPAIFVGNPMKRKDFITSVHQSLLQRRESLLSAVSDESGLLASISSASQSGDIADCASGIESGKIGAQLAGVEFRELENIDLAIARIKDGSYGKCGGCKKNIPVARLEAVPCAKLCVACKRLAEESESANVEALDWSVLLSDESIVSEMNANIS
jgi:DnaK suppressor protein